MIKYFNPLSEQSLHESQKSNAFKWFMVSLIVLLSVPIIQSYAASDFSTSDYFLFIGQVFAILILFILRKYGLLRFPLDRVIP